MSKKIYEDAIEILANMGNVTIIEVIKALKQAQKQEKLLGLYKELIEVKNDMLSFVVVDGNYYDLEKLDIDLEKRIEELENE